MHGNVGEWCIDWYGAYETATAMNPSGPSSGTRHIVRGGTFYDDAAGVRSAKRAASRSIPRRAGPGAAASDSVCVACPVGISFAGWNPAW